MKKIFAAFAVLALASVAFADDSAVYRNVCDSLSLNGHAEIKLVPAYIDETNWYGNPKTLSQDSVAFKRHETYETLQLNLSTKDNVQDIPISVTAACRETRNTEYVFAEWTTSKTWKKDSTDNYATYIYDIHALKMDGHDSTNTYNILAFVPDMIPENLSFKAEQLLFSTSFEFAFEWWFAGASYTHVYKGTGEDSLKTYMQSSFASSASNDSLKAFTAAINALNAPDTMKTVRVQVVKVVLSDSRKPQIPESSSSSANPVSCASTESSSSSANPVSCAGTESSSSSANPVSCAGIESSSSSENPVSCAGIESSSSSEHPVSCAGAESSSSSAKPVSCSGTESSSSSAKPVSCSGAESSSSSKPASSSSDKSSSSSVKESSSSTAKSSSSKQPETSSSKAEDSSSSSKGKSSSSEKPERLVTVRSMDDSARMVQVRTLDGSVVKNSAQLAPGVYYVKYSNGKWQKMAVLAK